MPTHRLTVELLRDVAHLGRKGDVIEVSASQARNALIPQGVVRELTPDLLKKREADSKKRQDQARMRLEQAFDMQKNLDGQELDFTLKGIGTKVFGGLSEHEILTAIEKKWGYVFEKRDIRLPDKTHIKTSGRHLVYIHITHDTIAKIFINVHVDEKK